MKKLIYIIFILPIGLFAQIQNSNFENWAITNGNEQPVNWVTNNSSPSFISVEKTTDSYSGAYAIKVRSNGPSFEGPAPGEAHITFFANQTINSITAYIKCDSIVSPGKCIIEVIGYLSGISQQIGYWETDTIIANYQMTMIPISYSIQPDSFKISIIGYSQLGPLGYNGFAELKVDHISVSTTTNIENVYKVNEIKIFPNPSKGEINIEIDEINVSYIKVYSIDGKLLSEPEFEIGTNTININQMYLKSGIYLLEICLENSQKIIERLMIK